jgi:predicted glycosyltransferase
MICEVNLGMGHFARMVAIGRALSQRFRVSLVVVTSEVFEIEAFEGIQVYMLLRPRPPILSGHRVVTEGLLKIVNDQDPAVILIEFFPFARHAAVFYFLPFLKHLRSRLSASIHILCSLRDIQDHQLEALSAESVARLANQHFDAILVHSDPCLIRLEDTFAAADSLRIPIVYTNYVSRHGVSAEDRAAVSKTIVISAGGGRGGETLLDCAIYAAKQGLLSEYRLRILAGRFLLEPDWRHLAEACDGGGDSIELLRWVPDLFTELRNAAVSVSRFGYNTTMDLLAARVPSLVIPHTTKDADEQLRRAELFAKLGLIRMLREQDMTPVTLAAEIRRTIGFHSMPHTIGLDGAERTCEIVSWIAAGNDPFTIPNTVP